MKAKHSWIWGIPKSENDSAKKTIVQRYVQKSIISKNKHFASLLSEWHKQLRFAMSHVINYLQSHRLLFRNHTEPRQIDVPYNPTCILCIVSESTVVQHNCNRGESLVTKLVLFCRQKTSKSGNKSKPAQAFPAMVGGASAKIEFCIVVQILK